MLKQWCFDTIDYTLLNKLSKVARHILFVSLLLQNLGLKNIHVYILYLVKITRRESVVEHELLTVSEHLTSPRFLVGVHVVRSVIFCVVFVDNCLSFCPFSFDLRLLITSLVSSTFLCVLKVFCCLVSINMNVCFGSYLYSNAVANWAP
jgi:hypothetical protein